MREPVRSPHCRDWLACLGLTLAIFAVYARVLHAGFIWDDDAHLTRPGLRSLHGLWSIWSEPGATQQYYPLLHSAFWVEYRLWDGTAFWYHLVNVVLHAAAACLFFRILRSLAVPGAFLGAAAFGLHPVCVESVAWISEQKNTLSAVFFLAAALAYVRYDRERRPGWYALGLGLFGFAVLSKSVTATLPAAILVVLWWKRGRLSWRADILPLAPWLVLGVGAGAVTAWMERTFVGAIGPSYQLAPVERLLVAGRAIWFYAGKILWPADLIFIYPRWKITASDPAQYVWPAMAVVVLAVAWALRKRSRGPLATGLLFIGTLFPALGFINVFPFIYSFVADHFQYLASAMILPAAAAGFSLGANRLPAGMRFAAWAAVLGVLAALAGTTWRQCGMYADAETLWRATIARNPGCWMAYNNLGSALLESGRVDEAVEDIRASIKLEPQNAAARTNLGDALRKKGRLDDAFAQYASALRIEPNNVVAHNNLGNAFMQAGRVDLAVAQYQRALAIKPDYALAHTNLADAYLESDRLDLAIGQYHQALRYDPSAIDAHSNLGVALMRLGRIEEAITEFRSALGINPRYVTAQINLGNAFLLANQLDAAIAQYLAALAIDPNSAAAQGNLGFSLLRAGRAPEAMAHFERVLEIDPSTADGDPGYSLLRAGRLAEAVAHFQQALGMDPNSPVARKNLAAAEQGATPVTAPSTRAP